MSSPNSGGFIKPNVLSPPTTSSSSTIGPSLPHPRALPLKFGSSKESAFIRYMDGGVNRIQREFAKRSGTMGAGLSEDLKGYGSFKEVAEDIEKLVDVAWVSGTPSLQIPYLLSLALLTVDTMTGFPASPKALFRLLDKLDLAFASLLQGQDLQTGEPLPGFQQGKRVNDTEKVRIKSLIERTRITVVDVMSSGEREADDDGGEITAAEQSMDEDGGQSMDLDVENDDDIGWEMEVARVYDQTIVELGDTIGGTPIGIVTDN